jgi:hypothetical protein
MKNIALALAVTVFLISCSALTRYEYRYRVFYGIEISSKEQAKPEREAEIFYPLGSLNRAMDQFAQEGFQLYDYKRIAGGQNYIFKFRRPIKVEKQLERSADVRGIYRLTDPEKKEVKLWAVLPGEKGKLRVVEIKDTGNAYNAAWSGDSLLFHLPTGLVRLQFSKDGAEVNGTIERTEGKEKRVVQLKGAKY